MADFPEIDTRSLELLESVTRGLDFSIPDIDWDSDVFKIPESLTDALQNVPEKLTEGSLTERIVHGSGMFDALMDAVTAHLKLEYCEGRITGAEYTKAYISAIQFSMQYAVQYLLGKDLAYFQALGAQVQGITASIAAMNAKVQLAVAQSEAHLRRAQYANGVLTLAATESGRDHTEAQTDTQKAQTDLVKENRDLVTEQIETQRGQTCDTRSDGTVIVGTQGKQKDLYNQQITSYQRDAELKAARLWSDAWITQKGIDETLLPPDQFVNAQVNEVLTKIKEVNGI